MNDGLQNIAIRCEGLSKTYGQVVALQGLDLEVEAGEIFGFLGPNGAGKTTTLSIVSGILKPDAGSVEINGLSLEREPKRAHRLLGVVPQDITLYEDLSARENLLFWGRIYGLSGHDLDLRIRRLLDRAGLAEKAKGAVRAFSGGMKRRLNLLTGMVHEPKVLLLDEATVGIDPQGRLAILDMIREIADSGTAVVYTTHYLEEAEDLCRRVGIIDHGRMLVEGTVDELMKNLGEGEIVILAGNFTDKDIRETLESRSEIRLLSLEDRRAVLSVALSGPDVLRLLDMLLANIPTVDEISVRKPSLQSLFIKLTGREIRD